MSIYKQRCYLEYRMNSKIILKPFDTYFDRMKWKKDNQHRYQIIHESKLK